MKALSEHEIKKFLAIRIKTWTFDGKFIQKGFKFKSFVEAFSFMTAVALEAEKLDHHPDWNNVYNSLTIRLNTHDANGITELDFTLAERIDGLFARYLSGSAQ